MTKQITANNKYCDSSELKSIMVDYIEQSAEDLRLRLRAEWKKQKRVEYKYRQYAQSGI